MVQTPAELLETPVRSGQLAAAHAALKDRVVERKELLHRHGVGLGLGHVFVHCSLVDAQNAGDLTVFHPVHVKTDHLLDCAHFLAFSCHRISVFIGFITGCKVIKNKKVGGFAPK